MHNHFKILYFYKILNLLQWVTMGDGAFFPRIFSLFLWAVGLGLSCLGFGPALTNIYNLAAKIGPRIFTLVTEPDLTHNSINQIQT